MKLQITQKFNSIVLSSGYPAHPFILCSTLKAHYESAKNHFLFLFFCSIYSLFFLLGRSQIDSNNKNEL
ncbi:MAG: hypothetical protein H0V82_03595 [Candidatus Protochlamydia sp.]|nr:hypothetical protein [Candidatus Protochlamydia sp.]